MDDVQGFFGFPFLNGSPQTVGGHFWSQTSVNHRFGISLDHIPSFGFSKVWRRERRAVGIVRMNLDTENAIAIQIFEQ